MFDVVLAGAVTGAGLVEIWVPLESRQGHGSAAVSSAATVVAGLALTQRRHHPLAAGLATLLVWPVLAVVGGPIYVLFFGQFLPMAIAVFSMARFGAGRVPFLGAAAAAATLLLADLTVEELRSPGEIFFHWTVFAVVWGFGFGLRRAADRAQESTRRAIAAEVAAAEHALAAVLEERNRIARELHDIVAHAVSMMVVQAGAAEQVVDDDPAYARRALSTIRRTGTDALTEMRRVVAVLRADESPGTRAPQPGLDALPGLVEDARAAGVTVDLDVEGHARPLPAGVELAAYRIVQEALTNVRRHASASRAWVRLAYGDADLRIEVADDGIGSVDPHGGHGLAGMRERAELYGGWVDTASASGSGLVVRAYLPTEATP